MMTKKKLLCFLMMLCMVFTLIPVSAFAESDTVKFSALDGTGTGGYGYDNLIDGRKTADSGSKWLVSLPKGGAYIIMKASEPVLVSGYTFTTGNDNASYTGRNPKNWTLYGSTDYDETCKSGTWVAISTVENDDIMQDLNYTSYSFQVSENDTYYQYYKLVITAVHSGNTMQLGEMEFSYTPCEHNWKVISSTEADCTHPKYETKSCMVGCGTTVTVPVGSPLGHINNGSDNCTRCGKVYIQQLGSFTVSNAIKDEDYTYENNELKILTASPITIRNTNPNTATTLDRIVVAKDVSANVTLAGVNIDVSATNKACAFKIEDDSRQDVTVTLLEGTKNILKSGSSCAGIQKHGRGDSIGTLYIKGSGMLEVTGGDGSAEIGAGQFNSVRCIEICSGNIIAQGGKYAAGIGGANVGVAKDIMITGGVIRATGGTGGPGIGGGAAGNIYRVTITGGVVYAEGVDGGAGIGAGDVEAASFGEFIISGGTVTAKGGGAGADDVGNGGRGSGSNKPRIVAISGGSVKADSITDPKNTPGENKQTVYPLTIENPKSKPVYLDGIEYLPVNHTALDSNDTNLYLHLTEKTADNKNHTIQMNGKRSEISLVDGVLTVGAWKDVEAPVISGLTVDKTYCGSVRFSVTDNDGVASVTVGGETLQADADGKYTLKAGIGKVKVVATDNEGNTADITVTVNADHTGGCATCIDKAICVVCGEEYGEVDCSNHVDALKHIEAKAATSTEEGNCEYWYCDNCKKYFADEKGTIEIAKEDTAIGTLPVGSDNATATGDDFNMAVLLILLIAASGTLVGTSLYSRKRQPK